MRRVTIVFLLAMIAITSVASEKKETLEQLKARAQSAEGKHEIELATEIAERQVKATDEAYSAGNVEQAQAALTDVVEYGVRAAKEATNTGKRMKQTEIALRKISDRLDSIGKSIDVDSRPPVEDARRKLEAARNDLLFRMFK
jgi:hypothetical protein